MTLGGYGGRYYLRWSDVGIVAWVVFCVVLALAIGAEVRKLDRYGTTMDQSADALQQTASALHVVARIPLVGGTVGDVADDIDATASSIHESAGNTRSAAHNLSWLLTVAIIVLPTAPALAVYLPGRISELKTDRELLRSLKRARDAEFLKNYLANRALQDLPYETLERIAQDPWSEVRRGKTQELIESELRRLGLDKQIPISRLVPEEGKR
jgi:hypothetical protein